MLGTSDVFQELCRDPHAEVLKVAVDSDWVARNRLVSVDGHSEVGAVVVVEGRKWRSGCRVQKNQEIDGRDGNYFERFRFFWNYLAVSNSIFVVAEIFSFRRFEFLVCSGFNHML